MQGFKPPSPHHWVFRPVACGGLKPFSVVKVEVPFSLVFMKPNP